MHEPGGDYGRALALAYRALCEFRIEGIATNRRLLQELLQQDAVRANAVHTVVLDEALPALAARAAADDPHPALHARAAGGMYDTAAATAAEPLPDHAVAVAAPMDGALAALQVAVGERVRRGHRSP